MPYVAVVRLLIDTESEAEACDKVSAILTEQMQNAVPTSCLLDWRYEYSGSPEIVPMIGEMLHDRIHKDVDNYRPAFSKEHDK